MNGSRDDDNRRGRPIRPALQEARALTMARLIHRAVDPADVADGHRIRAARLVAQPGQGARILGPDNRLLAYDSVATAVLDRRAFFVSVAAHVMAFDFDVDHAEQEANVVYGILRVEGRLPLLLASGQPGRRHVFCVVPRRAQQELSLALRTVPSAMRRTMRPLSRRTVGTGNRT